MDFDKSEIVNAVVAKIKKMPNGNYIDTARDIREYLEPLSANTATEVATKLIGGWQLSNPDQKKALHVDDLLGTKRAASLVIHMFLELRAYSAAPVAKKPKPKVAPAIAQAVVEVDHANVEVEKTETAETAELNVVMNGYHHTEN